MKKKWVSQHHILHWFWDRSTNELLSEHRLEHDDELVEWCWQNDCRMEEMYIVCPDMDTYIMFALRWS